MKKFRVSPTFPFFTRCSADVADESLDKLVIQAIPSSEGTVVTGDVAEYEKTFTLVVYSESGRPVSLTGFSGGYKAVDEAGTEFPVRMVQARLLGILKKGRVKQGQVSFVSDDDSVYKARFVRWSPHRRHLPAGKD